MIIFIESGRLGNQLFQYCGLKHFFSTHKLVFIGCEDLRQVTDQVDGRFIPKRLLGNLFFFRFLRYLLGLFASIKILGKLIEKTGNGKYELYLARGFFNIYVAQNIFFQHRSFIIQNRVSPRIRPDLVLKAREWLDSKAVAFNERPLVFVHIRRTDYLHWPSSRYPAVLPLDWYRRAMVNLKERVPNAVFVVMGDDHQYLRDFFDESESLLLSENSPEIDLAVMSLCHSGILSASSFAWWGAYLARLRHGQGLFVAPKYWAGHRSKEWYPAGFVTDWLTYQE